VSDPLARDFHNILIIRQSALGDVVNTFPLVELLKQRYPHARVTYLSGSAMAPLLALDPVIDEVLLHDRNRNPLHFLPFLLRLRRMRFDLAVDFHCAEYTRWLSLATGAAVRLGHHHKGPFYTHVVPAARTVSACEMYHNILTPLGLGDSHLAPRFPAMEKCRAEAEQILRQASIQAGNYVVLNPGHSPAWVTKRWPLEHWIETGKRIRQQGFNVVVTGGRTDRELAESLTRAIGMGATSLAGMTSLAELAGIMGLARTVISTDSGPMHIAAMTGVPVIALFGPTNPRRNRPYGDRHTILHRELACSLCFKKRCPYQHECMTGIIPDMVLSALCSYISRP